MIPPNQRTWFEENIVPELQRLSRNGHAPGRHRWDDFRRLGLPTMHMLLKSLGLADTAALAQAAGLEPPDAGAMLRGTTYKKEKTVPRCADRNRGDNDERGLAYVHRTVEERRIVRGDTVIVKTRTAYMLR